MILFFKAIKSFANENSQGCDGLTAEFYITYSRLIGKDLMDVINDGFNLSAAYGLGTINTFEIYF